MIKLSFKLSFIFLCLLAVGVYANPPLPQQRFFRSAREVTRELSRSSRDLMLREVVSQWGDWIDYENMEWFNDTKIRYSYDEMGRLGFFEESYWHWDYDDWVENYSRGYINWGDNGVLNGLTLKLFNSDDEVWVDIMRAVQSSNNNGNIEYAAMELFTGEEWFPISQIDFFYDDDHRIERIVNYFDLDFGYSERDYEIEQVQFWYDSYGRMSMILVTGTDDGEIWNNIETSLFDYHQNDSSTYEDFQILFNNYSLMMAGLIVHGSALPFMIETEELSIWFEYGNDWLLEAKDSFYYNNDNQLTSIEFNFWAYDHWEPSDREIFSYNDGLLSEILYQWYNYEEWITNYRELFYYAESSNIEPVSYSSPLLFIKNYPNPFNPETTISFSLATDQKVELTVYNVLGQKVNTLMDTQLRAGNHCIVWRGDDHNGRINPSGIYFYRLTANETVVRGKMLLLK